MQDVMSFSKKFPERYLWVKLAWNNWFLRKKWTVKDKKWENLVPWYKFTFGVCRKRNSKSFYWQDAFLILDSNETREASSKALRRVSEVPCCYQDDYTTQRTAFHAWSVKKRAEFFCVRRNEVEGKKIERKLSVFPAKPYG